MIPDSQPSAADLEANIESCARDVLENPDNPAIYMRLGQCLCLAGMYAEAINAFEAAVSIDFAGTWFESATALEENGQTSAAMAIWRRRLQYLVGLKPGQGYVSNVSVKLPHQAHLDTELGRHAAAADIFASQGKDRDALVEFKAAVSCWGMAKYVKGEP
jgi:tetratricopeptide (TPR) repeat protein